MRLATRSRSLVVLCCVALSLSGCARNRNTETQVQYQRFVLVQVEQPIGGCAAISPVAPCSTVVLALDTKTGQVCRAASMRGENYPLCLRLYESYPDNKAEVEQLREQIKADKWSDWDAERQERREGPPPCPSDDPLGLRSAKPCQPLPSKKGGSK